MGKIIVIDGKPVETEEVVEDPVDISASEQFDTVNVDPTQNYSVQKVIRKRIVRKIVIVDGKPVETEEIIEDPVEVSTSEQFDTGNIDPAQDCNIQKVIRKRIKKKIVVIDGKPVETEEEIEDPVDISTSEHVDTVDVDPVQNYSVQKVIRKRIIRKIVVVDGKPV